MEKGGAIEEFMAIDLGGELNISTASSVRDQLLAGRQKTSDVGIDVSGAQSVDLAGLQVIWSAIMNGTDSRKGRFVLKGPVSHSFGAASMLAGFTLCEGLGCLSVYEGRY